MRRFLVTDMSLDLSQKLEDVSSGKLLSTELAIDLARLPEFAQRSLEVDISDKLFVNMIATSVWDLSQDRPARGTEFEKLRNKVDNELARYFEQHASTASEKLKEWYLNGLRTMKSIAEAKLAQYGEPIRSDTSHSSTSKKVLKCPECKHTFIGIQGLSNHRSRTHKIKTTKTPSNPTNKQPENHKSSRFVITNCPTCSEAGYKAVRYEDDHGKRKYMYGITHEYKNERAVFHQIKTLSSKEVAESLASKYGQTRIAYRQMRQTRLGKV